VISTFVSELALFGVAVLIDRRPRPIFPPWLGFLNTWRALVFSPPSFLVFFKTGPLAWNGLLVWWVPVAAFLLWFAPNFVCLLKAVGSDDGAPSTRDAVLERQVAELRARLDQLSRHGDTTFAVVAETASTAARLVEGFSDEALARMSAVS
jgi:hypothetical protein